MLWGGYKLPVPYTYSIKSIRARWASSIIAVLGIAGVVGVFIAVMAMAQGFQRTLVISGSKDNVIILRQGSTAEMMSIITLEQIKVISDLPHVERNASGTPLSDGEVVVVAAFAHKASGTNALGQVRGVSGLALEVHPNVKVTSGRFLKPGLYEFVVGKNASSMYAGLGLGKKVNLSGRTFTVVGIMESGGSLYESEIWCDAMMLGECYKRPVNIFSSASVKLKKGASLKEFRNAIAKDPRLNVEAKRESEFFEEQSMVMTTLIRVLGFLVAMVMAIGAVFGAFNTMYSSLASRTKEIATLRAIGFGSSDVIFALLFEAVVLALAGGVIGALLAWPLNGFTANTLNFQSFSQMAFAFRITPKLMFEGIIFAGLMGIAGGIVPALRAARMKPADALREV
jgi:putative ABC transport system permease protein